jgi:hypothetical protein
LRAILIEIKLIRKLAAKGKKNGKDRQAFLEQTRESFKEEINEKAYNQKYYEEAEILSHPVPAESYGFLYRELFLHVRLPFKLPGISTPYVNVYSSDCVCRLSIPESRKEYTPEGIEDWSFRVELLELF